MKKNTDQAGGPWVKLPVIPGILDFCTPEGLISFISHSREMFPSVRDEEISAILDILERVRLRRYQDPQAGADPRIDDAAANLEWPSCTSNGEGFLENINLPLYTQLCLAIARGDRAFLMNQGAFPCAVLKNSNGSLQAIVQLKPDLEGLSFLPENKIVALQGQMSEVSKELSDRTVDCLNVISIKWLESAESPDASVPISADDFLHLFGTKRVTTELRKKVALEIDRLKTLLITVVSMVVPGEHGKMRVQSGDPGAEESPAVIVTSRRGGLKDNGVIETFEWHIRLGDHLAQYLFFKFRPISLLPQSIPKLNPRTKKWEKRIGQYLASRWAAKLDGPGERDTMPVESLLNAVGDIFPRHRETKARLVEALVCLSETSELFVEWDYCGKDIAAADGVPFDEWVKWKVSFTVHPNYLKSLSRVQYKKKAAPRVALQRESRALPGIKEAIESRGLSGNEAARQIGINGSTLSRIIRGEVRKVAGDTDRKIKDWLTVPV